MRYWVAPGFPSSASRRGVARGRNARPAPLPCGTHALLAQLVEHFHGKEGGAGSSPAEGSSKRAADAALFHARESELACPDTRVATRVTQEAEWTTPTGSSLWST